MNPANAPRERTEIPRPQDCLQRASGAVVLSARCGGGRHRRSHGRALSMGVKRETAVRHMPNSQPLSEFEQERTSGRMIHTLEDVNSLRYEFAREQH